MRRPSNSSSFANGSDERCALGKRLSVASLALLASLSLAGPLPATAQETTESAQPKAQKPEKKVPPAGEGETGEQAKAQEAKPAQEADAQEDVAARFRQYSETGFDPVLAGAEEYDSACATCHGVEGLGDGPMVKFLTVRPPNLQLIAKRAGGIFPLSLVYDVIEGRERIKAHGDSMPVWGNAFRSELAGLPQSIDPWLLEAATIARIQSLVFYLESIQNYDAAVAAPKDASGKGEEPSKEGQ